MAIATRVTGVLMWPALACGPPGDRLIGRRAIRALAAGALVLSLAGFAWYCGYVYSVSGNPFEWAATLQRWNYRIGGAPGPRR